MADKRICTDVPKYLGEIFKKEKISDGQKFN